MKILNSIFEMFSHKNNNSDITIAQLNKKLKLFRNGKLGFVSVGIGITSYDGEDCIWFVKSNDKFNIEYSANTETQVQTPYMLRS